MLSRATCVGATTGIPDLWTGLSSYEPLITQGKIERNLVFA